MVLGFGSAADGRLSLALTGAAEQGAATLYVCGAAFPMRGAAYAEVAGEHTWSWDDSGLDWSNVGHRTLRRAVDEVAPELRRATAYGTGVSLTYDERLDETSTSGTNAFAVRANGASVAVSRVTVTGGGRVTLELAAPVQPGDGVTVLHNCVHTEDVAVRCTGTRGDHANQGPGLTFGAVGDDGLGVVLTFDEPLDPGVEVHVRYGDPTAGDDADAIQDEAGVDALSFGRVVANDRVAGGGQNPGSGGNPGGGQNSRWTRSR